MIPCPNCGCVGCTIATDNFDDASTTGWTTTGTVTEASGLMDLAEGATAIFDTASGSVSHDVAIRTDPLNTDDAAELRLRVCQSDGNNFLFGQFLKFDDGGTIKATLRLGQVLGGSETWLTDTVEVDDTDAELDARGDLCLSFEPGDVQTGTSLVTAGLTPISTLGTTTWFDQDQVFAEDDNPASYVWSAEDQTTDTLLATGFGATVPPGSTIDNIAVTVRARRSNDGTADDVRLTTLAISIDFPNFGNNLASNQLLTASYSLPGASASPATWGQAVTWENIFELWVAIEFTLADGTPGGPWGAMEVDVVYLEFDFTTPDRQPGKLTFSYTNTGAPQNTQCVKEFAVENPADGLKTGLQVVTGDWDFGTYTLNCTPCPCDISPLDCGACDSSFLLGDTFVVDLGAGGWTDDDCSGCAAVAGEVEVTHVPGWGDPIKQCAWVYEEQGGSCGAEGASTIVWFATEADASGTPRLYGATVWRTRISGGTYSIARYRSAFIETSGEECSSHFPVTLTKVYEDHQGACGGALPATITVSEP